MVLYFILKEVKDMSRLVRDEMYYNIVIPEDGSKGGNDVDLTDYYKKPEVDLLLEKKADSATMTTELGKKANTTDMTSALGKKADTTTMTTELGKKANTTDMTTALGNKADKNNVYTRGEVDNLLKALSDRIALLEAK